MRGFLCVAVVVGVFSCTLQGDRARYSDAQKDDSQGFSASFQAFFSESTYQKIEIVFTQEAWDRLCYNTDHRYDTASGQGTGGDYVPATFRYEGPAGNTVIETVGVRTRGNTTRRNFTLSGGSVINRAHLKVKFDETFSYAPGSPEYEKLSKQKFVDVDALNLKWPADDPTHIVEHYSYSLLNDAGVFAPRTGLVHLILVIDGVRYDCGVYTAIEPVDKQFFTKRLGKQANDGNIYKCLWQMDGPATLENESIVNPLAIGTRDWKTGYNPTYDRENNLPAGDNYSDLKEFIQKLNSLSGEALKQYLEARFDVDRFLRFLAVNQLLGNPDDYWALGNNYYLYFGNDGLIRFVPYDYDHGLGRGWYPTNMQELSVFSWWNMHGKGAPLVTKILAIPAYSNTYRQYLLEFMSPSRPLYRYSVFKTRYERAKTAFGAVAWGMNEDMRVKNFFYGRTSNVASQLGQNPSDFEIGTARRVVFVSPVENYSDHVSTASSTLTLRLEGDISSVQSVSYFLVRWDSVYSFQETPIGSTTDKASSFLFSVGFPEPGMYQIKAVCTLSDNSTNEEVSSLVRFYDNSVVSPLVVGNTVTFRFKPSGISGPTNMYVRGSFNGWQTNAAYRMSWTGSWYELTTSLSPGTYEYKFCLSDGTEWGGQWYADPHNPRQRTIDYLNSYVIVP